MLTEKQFRDRSKIELRNIGAQVLSLATDRDVYWKVEREIVQLNVQLQSRNAFLEMLRGAYVDAMAMRLLSLLSREPGDCTLPVILEQLAEHPKIMQDKLTGQEFANDRRGLQECATKLREIAHPHLSGHERTLAALASAHRMIDEALDLLIAAVKTYYWIVAEAYLDVDVEYEQDPLDIFHFAWSRTAVTQ